MPKTSQLPEPQTSSRPPLWGSILDAKIDQNGIQNKTKLKTIFKNEKNAFQEPLGAVLGRSWGAPTSKIVLPCSMALVFSKITFFVNIALGSPSWPPKMPEMTPTWHPKTSKNQQKSISKNDRNLDRHQDEFCASLGPIRRNALASWGD